MTSGHRRARVLGALAGTALVALGALGFSGTASATPAPDCKTVSAHITDRPDSGTAGDWALDTFDRKATICAVDKHEGPEVAKVVAVQSWTYAIKGTDEGTFTTKGVKSFQGHTMANGVPGAFSGAWSLLFEAPANWLGFTQPTNTNAYSTSAWIAHLWQDGFQPAEKKFIWGWKYQVCNETLINAVGGNHGDITGLSRVPCYGHPSFTSKCDGSVVVLLTNAAPSSDSKAAYVVSGVEAHHGLVLVAGGKPGQLSVTVKPDADGVVTVTYVVGREKIVKTYHFVKPVCTTPSTSVSAPAGVPTTTTPGLPVTGADTTAAAITGAVLVLAGVGLFVIVRRRRIRFEA